MLNENDHEKTRDKAQISAKNQEKGSWNFS